MVPRPAIPDSADAITATWMQEALAAGGGGDTPAIQDVVVEQVGVGIGLVAETLRCHLHYAHEAPLAPRSVIIKRPTSHRETLKLAKRLRLYQRECAYYRLLAHDAPIRAPTLLYGDFQRRTHRFILVLEDLGHMETFDEIGGVDAEHARRAVRSVASFHAYSWNRTDQQPFSSIFNSLDPRYRPPIQIIYLKSLRRTFELFGDHFSSDMRRLAEELGWKTADYIADLATGPRSFGHGDFRLDNMFFGPGDDDFAVVDWQVCGAGSSLNDVAYFVAGGLEPAARRTVEREAVAEYHEIVCRSGVEDFGSAECWRLYRHNMLTRLLQVVVSIGGLDISNERSTRLIDVALRRTLAALEDLEVEELLPARRRLFGPSWAFSTVSRYGYKASKALRKS